MTLRAIVCVVLWLAFALFGIALHRAAEKGPCAPGKTWVSIAGLDSEPYLRDYGCIGTVFNFRPRHPCAPLVMMPVYALGSRMAHDGHGEMVPPFVLTVFALLAATSVFLLWRISDDFSSVVLYLSFAYSWILAGTADYFTVSETILLATLVLVAAGVRDWKVWLGTALLAGGVTVTNGVKPLLAAFASGNLRQAPLRKCVMTLGICGVSAFVFVIVSKLVGWLFGFESGIATVFSYCWDDIIAVLPSGATFCERLNMFWQAFVCEPLLLHGQIVGVDNFFHYGSIVPHVLVALLLAGTVLGAIRSRKDPIVKAALAMVAVDFALHGLVGWGAAEGQIYCGHWFFVIPFLISRLPGRAWKLALAGGFAAWNVLIAADLL